MDSDNKDAVVVDYGVSELATGGATDIKYIGIMSTASSSEEQPDVVTVDSITFTVAEDEGGDQPGGEGGEGGEEETGRVVAGDILANFNSNFENGYWWNDANWGQTAIAYTAYADGETKPSATCGNQYLQVLATAEAGGTAMMCSADIAALFTEGKNYEFSYLVKLAEGATGDVRFELFSQTSGYANDTAPTFVYDEESYTLSDSEWTLVSGTFEMCDTQEQMWVRFTSAAGVSFMIDDIRIGEVADQGGDQPGGEGGEGGEEETGRVVAGDILANFNSNFENGYWWNDANWGQTAIAYTAYADGETKPSATCGNQYLQVLATAEAGGTAMMCSADIAALFTEGKNYEFSYLVKLAEGATGDVRFELFSQTSGYANDTAPTFVYDEESYTLSDSEWTLVSGTFEMCDTQEQMWVRFTSAAGVSFMIDDIRIGEVADQGGDQPGGEGGEGGEEETGRVVAGDILANFNSNFENGYWWNDANWGQTAIAYTAYADGETKPSATCGNQYLQVLATAEAGGTAMLCSADISALFTEGKNYEFSYLVKLAEGVSGDVRFELFSQTSGYANDTAPTFVYDEESYTLSDSEWTLVSGTFEMCDTQEQMWVRFTSAAGVGFMIDDIRIGEVEGQGGDEPGDEPDEEEGEKVTYTFADLTEGPQWSNNATVDADGKLTVGFTGHYAQRYYNIPADIDMSKVQKVIIDGFEGSNYELRLLTQENVDSGFSGAAVSTATGNTLNVGTNTDVAYVGFACTSSAASESAPVVMKADSVTFVYYPEGEAAPTTSTVEYHFGDIPVAAGGYGHNKSVDEYNRLNLAFTQQYGEVKFAIPAELKDQIITGIEVTPVSGNTSTLAVKVYDTDAGMSSGAQMHVSWGGMKFTISPSKLVGVGFMTTDSNDAVASNPLLIKKITFTVQGDFEGGSDFLSEVSYNFNDLTAAGGWNQVSSVTAKDGKLTMNFAEKYGEVQFAIPDEMLGKNITKMSFSTSVGNAADLAVKLYAGDTAVVTKYGETSFDISTEEDITKFAFMLNSDDVSPIVIDKVTFVVEADVENGSEFITEAYTTVPAAALEPVISGNVEVLDAEVNGGKLGINFNEEGAAVFFKIPSYVDMSKVKYVDLEDVASALSLVDTTYGTALNGVKLNAYTAADFATKTPTLTSDTSAVVTDGNANIKYIGLVSTAATASVSMTRVGFVEKNITKNGDMFSWTADNFVFDGTNSTASATAVDDNKWLCTFEEADDIAIFELPETFITGNAKDFAIAISKRDVPVVLSFLDAEMNEVWSTKNPERVQSYHNVDTVASRVDVKAKYLAISVKEGGAKMCVLDGISANKRVFSNEPYVVPIYTILTYTAADVLKMENDGWSGSTFEKLGETVKVNLPGTYGEISFKLPVKIDLAQCESVNIKLKNQNLPIAVKLMKNYDAVVVNYDRVLGERNFAPFSDAQINKFSLMSLESAPYSSAEFESITFTIKGDYVPEAISTGGIIVNGNFDDPDVSDWKAAFWDDVTITTEVSAKPIFGNVNTYGVYSKRTSPYQCFAQDITGRVVQDGTYTFSFWAKLSDDYKGAPDNQRVVQFSPYTVDVNGVPDYNPNLQGVYAQSLKVGEWTKYEGIWKITNANKIESVFVRILEQGTNYGQGDCVLGSYAITGVEIKEYIPDPPSIDEDVPDLKAALTQEFGDGFIVGTAITGNEFDDIGVEMLANKHFNAITLGNELKPDAMMGYSEKHTALQTITFNGQKLVVPTLTFSSADAKLNTILKWNKKHPESPIKRSCSRMAFTDYGMVLP